MTEKKQPLDFGLEDLDWDAAIAEWEQTTLVPEAPADREPQRAGTIGRPIPAAGGPPSTSRQPITARPPPEAVPTPNPDLLRPSPVPRAPRAGLDQLFKPRTPEQADADLAELLDLEPAETTQRGGLPSDPGNAGSSIDRDSEEALSATVVEAERALSTQQVPRLDSIDDTQTVADPEEFSGLPRPDDDEPTHYIQRKSAPPRTEGSQASHPADTEASTLERKPLARPPSARPPTDLASTVEAEVRGGGETTATRTFVRTPKDDDDAPTRLRPRSEYPSIRVDDEPEAEVPAPHGFVDEQPARNLVDDENKEALVERAEWFENEAREMSDVLAGARTLLAASEIYAMCGNLEAATRLAAEARDIDPRLPLAHWQARALLPRGMDLETTAEALDAEARHAIAPAHRLHATLVAAEHLRAGGADEAATTRWDHAAAIAPEDARAPTSRAVRALARLDYAHPSLRFAHAPATAAISLGVGTVLRLRGVERPDGDAGEILANDSLRRARLALENGDVATAATLLAELRSVPELARGAAWLASALGVTSEESRAKAGQWMRRLVGSGDDALARRALAAIGVELGEAALVDQAMTGDETFAPYERGVLAALMRLPLPQSEAELAAIAAGDGMEPLAAALAAISLPANPLEARTRARRTAGREASRKLVTLGRLLGTDAPDDEIDAALKSAQGEDAAKAIALELAARSGRYEEVSEKLATWSGHVDGDSTRDRQLAAGLVAERAGQADQAIASYKAARSADSACEPAVRALIELEPGIDRGMALADLADAVDDPLRGALLRLEAITRDPDLDDADVAGALEHVHKGAPHLPFAPFLAERIARKAGNVDEVLRWLRDRRARATDPLEGALDAVREALLIADNEPDLAAERIGEAHHARPEDVALRELYERLATEPPTDRGAWREKRAASTVGPSQALLYTEAAYEYERLGDKEACLRAAQAARRAGDEGLGRLALERAEVEAGSAARLADELLTLARSTENTRERREAYERLAELDAIGRSDSASALLWHLAILEFEPAYTTSLRYVEHTYVSGGRDEELEPIATQIARALAGKGGGEDVAHAELAVRLRVRSDGGWETTRDMAELAAAQSEPPLWALRLMNAHARAHKNDAQVLSSTLALVPRTTRPSELAALHLRAGEAAARGGDLSKALELLERAANEDPGDIATWSLLADVRQRSNDVRGAAEAREALARTSSVPRHQLLAWYDAARLWIDKANDLDRALPCLEQAAAIDITHEDVFGRLSALYSTRGAREELAALLEKRIANVTSSEERVELEVERGRALTDIGDHEGARKALKAALAEKPDHLSALGAYGDLCASAGDWEAAEQAWVRLARSLSAADEQRDVYKKLGELYAVHAVNLSRAEVAFKEVLKRAPNDAPTLERLVNVYARQNDAARAIETQQQLISQSTDAAERRSRIVQLAGLFDDVMHDARRAEQTLEAARREAPADVSLLRALAEFYARHKQLPAVNILLDRASSDARRALAAGRFSPGAFEMLQTVYDLRQRKDAARVVGATLAAFEGRAAALRGGDARAADPRLDDLLAPELLTPALRALLARAGDALDAASPLDLRALKAEQLPPSAASIYQAIGQFSHAMGVGPVQVLVSPQLGRTCVPCSSTPPMIILGESLLTVPSEPARTFLIMRALKLVQGRASSLVRTPAVDMAVLLAAWLHLFNPQWHPEGFNPAAINEAARRLHAGLPRQLPPDVGVIALDVAGSVGAQGAALGGAAIAWANRMALLAVGMPSAAFDAIAWSMGMKDGAPADPQERTSWATRTLEIKDLVSFCVSDQYAEARARLGLDKG